MTRAGDREIEFWKKLERYSQDFVSPEVEEPDEVHHGGIDAEEPLHPAGEREVVFKRRPRWRPLENVQSFYLQQPV